MSTQSPRQPQRPSRVDAILALIDSALAEYEAAVR